MQRPVAPGFPDEDILGAFERQRDEPDQKTGRKPRQEAALCDVSAPCGPSRIDRPSTRRICGEDGSSSTSDIGT
jgi:hypothetical protein